MYAHGRDTKQGLAKVSVSADSVTTIGGSSSSGTGSLSGRNKHPVNLRLERSEQRAWCGCAWIANIQARAKADSSRPLTGAPPGQHRRGPSASPAFSPQVFSPERFGRVNTAPPFSSVGRRSPRELISREMGRGTPIASLSVFANQHQRRHFVLDPTQPNPKIFSPAYDLLSDSVPPV